MKSRLWFQYEDDSFYLPNNHKVKIFLDEKFIARIVTDNRKIFELSNFILLATFFDTYLNLLKQIFKGEIEYQKEIVHAG